MVFCTCGLVYGNKVLRVCLKVSEFLEDFLAIGNVCHCDIVLFLSAGVYNLELSVYIPSSNVYTLKAHTEGCQHCSYSTFHRVNVKSGLLNHTN